MLEAGTGIRVRVRKVGMRASLPNILPFSSPIHIHKQSFPNPPITRRNLLNGPKQNFYQQILRQTRQKRLAKSLDLARRNDKLSTPLSLNWNLIAWLVK